MSFFELSNQPIDVELAKGQLVDPRCGGYNAFEGWVRDHNEGKRVLKLEYEAYPKLAVAQGQAIVADALDRFDIVNAHCIHRTGQLAIAELAVWVGVSAAHRGHAFAACRYIIDEVKHHVPIWKKEYYADGTTEWVNCAACAAD